MGIPHTSFIIPNSSLKKMVLEDFIPLEGQRRIAEAITVAERCTSGEICVHVTPHCRGDVMRRAERVFNGLGLYATRHRNAVLIFVAYDDRRLAILGDTSINAVVPKGLWDDEVRQLVQALQEGKVVDALCESIARMGNVLGKYFPAEPDDKNELSNEVSYDEEVD